MKKLRRILIMFMVAMTVLLPDACKQDSATTGNIVDTFLHPDVDAKPMARMWFPDAGAGASEEGLAMVTKHINEMAKGGFGGVEIQFLSDQSDYGNDQAHEIGWGSENWKKVLKQILRTANAIEGGFKVDLTITAHWPPIVNNIDPNDDAAAQEASFAYKKITNEDMAAGMVDLPLPMQKEEDNCRCLTGNATFLLTDKFVSATLMKVSGFDENGNPVFELSSLEDVSSFTKRKVAAEGEAAKTEGDVVYAGYAAGIPDQAYCMANGLDYQADIIALFGPEPADNDFTGKIDEAGNRKRMADWQYLYETDLSTLELASSPGDRLQTGDYVIAGNYYRGTGQVMSGGDAVTIYNRSFATDYFSDIGIRKVFEFWNDHILDDELIELLKENGEKNGTSIFEDSIEASHSGPFWTNDLLDEFESLHHYNVARFTPILATGQAGSFDDMQEASRIIEDYNLLLGSLYAEEHAALIRDWASSFNYTYRAQGYGISGLDVSGAALALDIPEGDNGTAGDGVRHLVSAVNIRGSKMMSMESTTFSANMNSKWSEVITELNADFSDGINRSILHGSPFARTFNGYYSGWPGWNFFKFLDNENLNGSGFSAWNYRQIYWDDVATASGYMARTQAVMQNGQAKVDLAVLTGSEGGRRRGNSLQSLLDMGYSYNVMTEPIILHENAVVENGILAAEGPAYKALIIMDAVKISSGAMERVLEFVRDGLPVMFYNCDITSVYGTNKETNNDEKLLQTLGEITSGDHQNVITASSDQQLITFLQQHQVAPAASYNQPGLEASHRLAGEGNYYYLFNDNGQASAYSSRSAGQGGPAAGPGGPGEAGSSGGPDMQGENAPNSPGQNVASQTSGNEATDNVPDYSIHTTVTLEGEGVPYVLDAWTGEVQPVAQYVQENGKTSLSVSLEGKEAMIICIASDVTGFPSADIPHVTDVSGGQVVYDNGIMEHRADASGTYTIRFQDNTEKTITADHVPDMMALSDNWDLELESWGPSPEAASLSMDHNIGYELDPSVSEKIKISVEDFALCNWNDLPVSNAQLTSLGVNTMDVVSGIGQYSTTFELPQEWTAEIGAYLKMEHGSDNVAEVRLNGNLMDDINQMTGIVDVGNYLQSGTNNLEIKLDSSLQNRDPAAIRRTSYGLTGVSLVPYCKTTL